MKRFALIGGKLGHSFSPEIHKMLGDYIYELKEAAREDLEDLLGNKEYDGFNVTIPYKKTVMEYCNYIAPEAEKIGSVNVIVRDELGKLKGYNTDYYGFCYLVRKTGIEIKESKCLVLGSGGTSATVRTALSDMGAAEIVMISRSGENNYDNIQNHNDADVIVNTTPVGMFPNIGVSMLDMDMFKQCKGVLDVIYNPVRTKLIEDAQARSIPASGGLAMLVAQAKKTSELFMGNSISDNKIETILSAIEEEKN